LSTPEKYCLSKLWSTNDSNCSNTCSFGGRGVIPIPRLYASEAKGFPRPSRFLPGYLGPKSAVGENSVAYFPMFLGATETEDTSNAMI